MTGLKSPVQATMVIGGTMELKRAPASNVYRAVSLTVSTAIYISAFGVKALLCLLRTGACGVFPKAAL